MNDFLSTLEGLNRKGRFFVFTQATDSTDIRLWPAVTTAFRSHWRPDPPDARAYIDYHYIDYHIDWIHTAVELARNPGDGEVRPNDPRVSTGKPEEYAASSPASYTLSVAAAESYGAARLAGQLGAKYTARLAR